MIVDKMHFSILTKTTGQKQIDKQLQKTIIAKKQESRNVPDWAISMICFAFTFWNVFRVLWMKLTSKEVLLITSWLSKKVGLLSKNVWKRLLGMLKKFSLPQISSLKICLSRILIGKSKLSITIGTKLRLLETNPGFVKVMLPVAMIWLSRHCIMFVLSVDRK